MKALFPPNITSSTLLILSSSFSLAFQAMPNANVEQSPQSKTEQAAKAVKPLQPKMYKAIQGSALGFSYTNLPAHEGLRISFEVHFVGPWDGTGVAEFGPDRFIAKVDNKLHLLDATFNNCQLVFANNIWQSFPDPHQYRQLAKDARVSFLYHGGEGASAISSLGFPWGKSKSMDSSYRFSFIVSHKGKNADLSFLTKWVEGNSVSTYWIENLEVKPIIKLKEPNARREEKAWLSFLRSDGHQAQKAWAEVYAAHPEKFIRRVQRLMKADPKRVDFLIKQLGKGNGKIPTRSIQKEVIVEPDNKNAKQILSKIYYLRELVLTRGLFSTNAGKYSYTPETNSQVRAIRKALVMGWERSIMLEQISLRISGYLRMINTREAHYLAAQFDNEDPEFSCSPIQPFIGTWKDSMSDFNIIINQQGAATSSANDSGTWMFSKDELVITWKNGGKIRLNLLGNKIHASLTNPKLNKVNEKMLLKIE